MDVRRLQNNSMFHVIVIDLTLALSIGDELIRSRWYLVFYSHFCINVKHHTLATLLYCMVRGLVAGLNSRQYSCFFSQISFPTGYMSSFNIFFYCVVFSFMF